MASKAPHRQERNAVHGNAKARTGGDRIGWSATVRMGMRRIAMDRNSLAGIGRIGMEWIAREGPA